MSEQNHDIWAMRLNEAIRSKRKEEGQGAKTDGATLKDLLLEFTWEAAAIVGAIGRNVEDVEILGNDRASAMAGILDELLKFEDFSLLEYRYKIPGKREPGLRFRVETRKGEKSIGVYFFEDLVFWPVDEEGKRIFREPVRFDLHSGRIRAVPNPETAAIFARSTDWRTALRETLTLPFRHLYEREF